MSWIINLFKRFSNNITGYDLKAPQYFRNRRSDVPSDQNSAELADTEIPSNDYVLQIPVENPESSDKPSGFKVPFQRPVFTLSVSVIQWVIFSFAMEEGDNRWIFETFQFDHSKRHQIWRLLTNLFVHYSDFHLRCNLTSQLLIGLPLEIVHGWKRIVILYFCSGLIGTLTEFTLDPLTNGMGASDAISGLVTANLATVLMNWNEVSCPCGRTIIAILDIMPSLVVPMFMSTAPKEGKNYEIGHVSHISGGLGGIIVSVFVLKVFQKAEWKTKVATICLYIAVLWIVLGVGANIGQQIFYWKVSDEFMRLRELAWNNRCENCTSEILKTI